MQKTTNAMVAVGAAIVLMLGGGGSLAYWQKSVDTGALTFETGYMSFDNKETLWSLNGAPIDSEHLETLHLVPGDTLEYRKQMFVEALGNDLYLAAEVDFGDLSAVHFENAEHDKTEAIAEVIHPTYTLTGDHRVVVTGTSEPNVFGIDLEDTIGDLFLTITFEWPFGEGGEVDETADARVSLSSTSITVRQVPAPVPEEN